MSTGQCQRQLPQQLPVSALPECHGGLPAVYFVCVVASVAPKASAADLKRNAAPAAAHLAREQACSLELPAGRPRPCHGTNAQAKSSSRCSDDLEKNS